MIFCDALLHVSKEALFQVEDMHIMHDALTYQSPKT